MSLKRNSILTALTFLLIVMMASTALAAPPLDSAINNPDNDVGLTSLNGWSFYFSPKNVGVEQYTYGTGEVTGATYLWGDAYIEMLLADSSYQPEVTSRSAIMPHRSFVREYSSTFGGQCWVWYSGRLGYSGTEYFKLTARTKQLFAGSYQGLYGSRYMIPNTHVSDFYYVK